MTMVAAVPFDTLALARKLREEAGFDQRQAEGVASALGGAPGEQLATKADLQAVKADLQAVKGELRAEIQALRTELKGEIQALRTELKGDLGRVQDTVTIRLGGLVTVGVGILIAIKFFA